MLSTTTTATAPFTEYFQKKTKPNLTMPSTTTTATAPFTEYFQKKTKPNLTMLSTTTTATFTEYFQKKTKPNLTMLSTTTAPYFDHFLPILLAVALLSSEVYRPSSRPIGLNIRPSSRPIGLNILLIFQYDSILIITSTKTTTTDLQTSATVLF